MYAVVLLTLATIAVAGGIFALFRFYWSTSHARCTAIAILLLLGLANAWGIFFFTDIFFGTPGLSITTALLPLAVFCGYILMEARLEAAQGRRIISAASSFHLPAIIEDVLTHPEKRAIMEQILANPDQTTLGGKRKNLAIMFTDIRGFSELSEKLDPDQLIIFLNDYLNAMSRIILENHGIVDKYIGDAIMAFWGPPLESPDHIRLAVQSAVDMMDVLHTKQKEWEKKGLPVINVGIGINAGEVVVGNIGCEKRFDYTCVGDQVNLAERLEELNKVYGTSIIISEQVHRTIAKMYVCRQLDIITIPGKSMPILIYEVLGRTVDQKTSAFLHYYRQAFALYQQHQWSAAKEAFAQALALRKDKVSTILMERCFSFSTSPPPDGWKGFDVD